ncbi:hypothetical protein ABIB73_000240 [Bradyrhizobium sp. F1.4.3]
MPVNQLPSVVDAARANKVQRRRNYDLIIEIEPGEAQI